MVKNAEFWRGLVMSVISWTSIKSSIESVSLYLEFCWWFYSVWEGSWRRCTAVVQEPTTPIQQSLIKLLIGFMLCFFHIFPVPALPSASAQLPATFVFPPGTAFQAFGVGLLNSRLPILSSGLSTVPFKAQHPWFPDLQRSCIPAGSVSQPAPCPAVVLCTQVFGGLSDFGCAGSEAALSPELHVLCAVPCFGPKHKEGGWSQFSERKLFSISESCYVQLLVMLCFFLYHQIITSTVILFLQLPSTVL